MRSNLPNAALEECIQFFKDRAKDHGISEEWMPATTWRSLVGGWTKAPGPWPVIHHIPVPSHINYPRDEELFACLSLKELIIDMLKDLNLMKPENLRLFPTEGV